MDTDEHRLQGETGGASIGVHPRAFVVDELNATSEKIIGCAYDVANGLGAGLLEKVYENAMRIELSRAGLAVLQQHPIPVYWCGDVFGDYYADLLVNNAVIVELKAVKAFDDIHFALSQLLEGDESAAVPSYQLWKTEDRNQAIRE